MIEFLSSIYLFLLLSLSLKMCMWVFGLLIGFWSLSPVISIEECSEGFESLLSYSKGLNSIIRNYMQESFDSFTTI
jgi:hypothetical protein